MAEELHLDLLRKGSSVWNASRRENVELREADLANADLDGANLSEANLRNATLERASLRRADMQNAELNHAQLRYANLFKANLHGANLFHANLRDSDLGVTDLRGANLQGADLHGADLRGANLEGTNLWQADLRGSNLYTTRFADANLHEANLAGVNLYGTELVRANLSGSNLSEASLRRADLTGADLRGADLRLCTLVSTKLQDASLSRALVYGVSAWDIIGKPAEQEDLVITPPDGACVTVDSLKMAQFIYLLLANEEMRDAIDTITSKLVLILGRFTEERKAVLDAMRDQLREQDCIPVIFDFSKPATRGYGETVTLLARMARYIIADLTGAAEIRSELIQIVPVMKRLPVQPLLLSGSPLYSAYASDIEGYGWVLPLYEYQSNEQLLATLQESVIGPAHEKWRELARVNSPPLPPVE